MRLLEHAVVDLLFAPIRGSLYESKKDRMRVLLSMVAVRCQREEGRATGPLILYRLDCVLEKSNRVGRR